MKKVIYILMFVLLLTFAHAAQQTVYAVKSAKPVSVQSVQKTAISKISDKELQAVALNFTKRNLIKCEDKCKIEATKINKEQTAITLEKKVKFLGFTMVAKDSYQLDNTGKILRRNTNFAQFLYNLGLATEG